MIFKIPFSNYIGKISAPKNNQTSKREQILPKCTAEESEILWAGSCASEIMSQKSFFHNSIPKANCECSLRTPFSHYWKQRCCQVCKVIPSSREPGSLNGVKVQKTQRKNTPLNKEKTHYSLHLFKEKLLLTSLIINKGAIKYHIIKGMGMKIGWTPIKRQKKKKSTLSLLAPGYRWSRRDLLLTNIRLLLKVRKLLSWVKKLYFVPIFPRKGVTYCEEAQQQEQKRKPSGKTITHFNITTKTYAQEKWQILHSLNNRFPFRERWRLE